MRNFILKTFSYFIDLTIIITFSIIFSEFIPLNEYFRTMQMFLVLYLLYFFISYYFFGKTIGKTIFNLKLISNLNAKLSFWNLIKRELLFKYFIIILLAVVVFFFFPQINTFFYYYIDFNVSIIVSFFLVGTINLIFYIFTSKSIWDKLSNTKFIKLHTNNRKLVFRSVSLFVFFVVTFIGIVFYNNIRQNTDTLFLEFKYPTIFKQHALNKKVREEILFIDKQTISAKDYIFELFEKYDIVVLCERNHLEITQWDFITEIVKDERFIKNVGNIFTEYGAVSKQNQIDSLLNTKFESVDSLQKSFSKLMKYRNQGFYNFICNLNLINAELPDSLKLREFFTDFDYFNEYFPQTYPNDRNRDSLMADIVITKYKEIQKNENRKKILVITNYRHAFGPIDSNSKLYNQTEFIFNAFPNKTANVLLNQFAKNKNIINYPIHFGEWDRAFAQLNDKQIGFNFKNSPFGECKFDLYPFYPEGITYQDVFTGFVFVNSPKNFVYATYYPYREYGAMHELILKNKTKDLLFNQNQYLYSKKDNKPCSYEFNLIPYLFYFVLLFFSLIIILLYLLFILRNKSI